MSKLRITNENSAEWLSSCGFLFPMNEVELARFEQLHGPIDEEITGEEVNPFKIITQNQVKESGRVFPMHKQKHKQQDLMVAKVSSSSAQKILERFKKNIRSNNDGNGI